MLIEKHSSIHLRDITHPQGATAEQTEIYAPVLNADL